MLTHRHESDHAPKRVVILGGGGFVGRRALKRFVIGGIDVVAPGSRDLDLAAPSSVDALAGLLQPDDALVFAACLTPDKGKDIATANKNLAMASHVSAALAKRPVAQLVYLSSDAVYGAGPSLVDERTPAAPDDLYGGMHLMRELMCRASVKADALVILRLSLIYGPGDTHNSYGPNRFRRQAAKDKRIPLFGEGEETRDHVFVEDAAALIELAARRGSHGLLNIASGTSHSFRQVAEAVVAAADGGVTIAGQPRGGPITHRHYDPTDMIKAFPDFRWTALADGVRLARADLDGG